MGHPRYLFPLDRPTAREAGPALRRFARNLAGMFDLIPLIAR